MTHGESRQEVMIASSINEGIRDYAILRLSSIIVDISKDHHIDFVKIIMYSKNIDCLLLKILKNR